MNPFQSQYPLSPRKFWKKYLPTLIPTLIFAVLGGTVFTVFFPVLMHQDSTVSGLLMLAALVSLGLFLIITALYAWYFGEFIRTYYYQGEDNFVTIKKGVFTPKEIHVQYQKIQDVYVDQDLLDRVMGLYDVHIASATVASGMEAHIDGVNKEVAEGLKNFFLAKIQSGMTPTQPTAQGAPATPVSPGVQFSEEISNKTYPLQGRWMVKSIIGMIFTSFFVGLFATFYLWARTSQSSLHTPFLPVFLVISVGFFILHLIGLLLWKYNYRFQFMPEYIQFHTGILSQSERHLPYKSIQDVNISQSLLDRMFGLSNVSIENAAQMAVVRGRRANGSIKLVGLNPADASKITEQLKNVILSKDSSHMGL